MRDNLEAIGRPAGKYVTEYQYRDPLFDGRQREFRGFSVAETRSLGDETSPTSTTRSTFLLGECRPTAALDVCSPAERWRDAWREPLKGLPVLVESFDDAGVYLSTAHSTYQLRQLYSGRDGRSVSAALPVAQEFFGYDTASFAPASLPINLDEVLVNVDGLSDTETRNVIRRATGSVMLRGTQTTDDFGSPLQSQAEGCVQGGASPDEVITTHQAHDRVPGDTSGWLFRPMAGFVTGSVHTEARGHVLYDYDARGDLVRTRARLSGTLPLDRFHSGGGSVSPAPPGASGGVGAPVDILVAEQTRDSFGNVIAARSGVGRCRTVQFDAQYGVFPVVEVALAGDVGTDGCGTRQLTTTAQYDRGLVLLTNAVDVSGQPVRVDYDGFGRVVAKTFVDPSTPGQLAALPAVMYSYELPADPTTSPFSRVMVRSQDGPNASSVEYLEAHSFVDGLGRTLAVLSEADPTAGAARRATRRGVQVGRARTRPPRRSRSSPRSCVSKTTVTLAATTTARDYPSQQLDARAMAMGG